MNDSSKSWIYYETTRQTSPQRGSCPKLGSYSSPSQLPVDKLSSIVTRDIFCHWQNNGVSLRLVFIGLMIRSIYGRLIHSWVWNNVPALHSNDRCVIDITKNRQTDGWTAHPWPIGNTPMCVCERACTAVKHKAHNITVVAWIYWHFGNLWTFLQTITLTLANNTINKIRLK